MPSLDDLKELYIEADTFVVMAAEEYPEVYRKAPKQYAQLRRNERAMALRLKEYFAGLPQRAIKLVRWPEYQRQVIKAYDIEVELDSQDWDVEASLMLNTVFDPIFGATNAGVDAGDYIYGVGAKPTLGAIQKRAADHALELARSLNQTTHREVKNSIETSLKLGESLDDAAARLDQTLNDPYRAEMIARTESIKAYQGGMLDYGKESGAVSKTWQTAGATDEECTDPVSDGDIAIDAEFSNGDDAPPAHPNCRCGLIINYANGDSDEE